MSISNSIYSIRPYRGVWRVNLDGKFYGDYRSKEHALESVTTARRALEASGRRTGVLLEPSLRGDRPVME